VQTGYEENATRAVMSEAWRNFCNPGTNLYGEKARSRYKLTCDHECYLGIHSRPEGTGAVSRYKAEPEPENLSGCRILIASRCAYPGASV
jgi:hypothetical protein